MSLLLELLVECINILSFIAKYSIEIVITYMEMSLIDATESNNKEEVERLLQSGADINQKNKNEVNIN